MLIFAELKRYSVSLSEKNEVREIIKGLIQQGTTTHLTERGTSLLNEYASGGFDVLLEETPEKPVTAEEFLCNYPGWLDKILKKSPLVGK